MNDEALLGEVLRRLPDWKRAQARGAPERIWALSTQQEPPTSLPERLRRALATPLGSSELRELRATGAGEFMRSAEFTLLASSGVQHAHMPQWINHPDPEEALFDPIEQEEAERLYRTRQNQVDPDSSSGASSSGNADSGQDPESDDSSSALAERRHRVLMWRAAGPAGRLNASALSAAMSGRHPEWSQGRVVAAARAAAERLTEHQSLQQLRQDAERQGGLMLTGISELHRALRACPTGPEDRWSGQLASDAPWARTAEQDIDRLDPGPLGPEGQAAWEQFKALNEELGAPLTALGTLYLIGTQSTDITVLTYLTLHMLRYRPTTEWPDGSGGNPEAMHRLKPSVSPGAWTELTNAVRAERNEVPSVTGQRLSGHSRRRVTERLTHAEPGAQTPDQGLRWAIRLIATSLI